MMNGKKAKKLRKKFGEAYPLLYQKHGSDLRPFKNLLKQVKRHYKKTGEVLCLNKG